MSIEAMKLVRDAIEQGIDLKLIGAKHILDQAIEQAQKQINSTTLMPSTSPKVLQPEQEPVARYKEKCADGSRCLHGCLTGEACYCTRASPPQRQPLTDEMVLLGAKALAKRHADSCGLDFDDVWKYYADEHKDDAKAVLLAANGIKEKNT